MYPMNIKRAIGLSALAAGLATTAFGQVSPQHFYQDNPSPVVGASYLTFNHDLDFSKTSVNPAINFPTFTNPRNGANVRGYTHTFVAAQLPGGCFEIRSSGPAGSDLIMSVQNQAGAWNWLADDNNGGGHFNARIFLPDHGQYTVRIMEYFRNNNNQASLNISKIRASGGSAITASSCRRTGMPFWQRNLNAGNPYNPS